MTETCCEVDPCLLTTDHRSLFFRPTSELLFDVFGQDIGFDVDAITGLSDAERGDLQRVGNDGHTESLGFDVDERHADAVDCDGGRAVKLAQVDQRGKQIEVRG